MTRTARETGRNGYIHIIERGVNHQDIFYHDSDYQKFLDLLGELKERLGFDVISYCLMTNHVHLLLHDKERRFAEIMRLLAFRYAQYFNRKYERSGHLFQDRYISRPITTKSHLLTVVAYIHNNPVKAHICGRDKYKWSSYSDYLKAPDETTFCSTDFVRSITGSLEAFIAMHDHQNQLATLQEQCFEYSKALQDCEVRDYLCEILQSSDPTSIQSLPKEKRNMIICELKKLKISEKQIGRITGISQFIISHVKYRSGTG